MNNNIWHPPIGMKFDMIVDLIISGRPGIYRGCVGQRRANGTGLPGDLFLCDENGNEITGELLAWRHSDG